MRGLQMQGTVGRKEALLRGNADDPGQEHIMTAQRDDLFYLAAQICRTLRHGRCVGQAVRRHGSQAGLCPFVHIPAALHAAVIQRLAMLRVHQVHREFAAVPKHSVGVAFLAHADGQHGRVAVDRAGPSHGQQIRLCFRSLGTAADEHCGHRAEQRTGGKSTKFRHDILPFLPEKAA